MGHLLSNCGQHESKWHVLDEVGVAAGIDLQLVAVFSFG